MPLLTLPHRGRAWQRAAAFLGLAPYQEKVGRKVPLEQWIHNYGYLALGFFYFLEYVFPPLPAQLALPIAGALIAQGRWDFWAAWMAASIGSLLGSLLHFYAGRWLEEHFLHRYGKYLGLSSAEYARSQGRFARHGVWWVWISHLTPLSPLRIAAAFLSGAHHMPLKNYLVYAGSATALWVGLQLWLVVQLGQQAPTMLDEIAASPYVALATLIGSLAVMALWWRWQRRRRPAKGGGR